MARSLRIQYPGAFYHVMARGNGRAAIFRSDADRTLFLKTLGEAARRTGKNHRGQSTYLDSSLRSRQKSHMARSLRIQYPGAFYHVMARGNGRAAIFRSDADRSSS